MESVTVKKDAKVLVPNKEHENFTETKDIIEEGTTLTGSFKSIKGLRRGKPFSYRVFIDNEGQIIYSDKVETMNETEVFLGVDSSSPTPTTVTLSPNVFKTSRIVGAVALGVGGYMYSKKKGYDKRKTMKYSIIGGLLGYAIMYMYDKSPITVITPKI